MSFFLKKGEFFLLKEMKIVTYDFILDFLGSYGAMFLIIWLYFLCTCPVNYPEWCFLVCHFFSKICR